MDDYTFRRTYSNLRKINKGGTGTIYLAYHCNLNKYVVLKDIDSSQDISIMRREVDILKNLKHRYLPAIYDFIEYEGKYFTVEDFIEGTDFTYFLEHNIALPEAYIIKWLKQLCEVLDYLHSRTPTIIHSDIKPGNIMVDTNGDICLIDFNISIFHDSNSHIIGYSNYFCAPEQMQQANDMLSGLPASKIKKIDARADIYSLAATFYALLSKQKPMCNGKNKPLSQMNLPYSEGLLRLIDKCMSINESKRCQSAKQMLNMLGHLDMMTHRYEVYRKLRACVSAGGVLLLAAGIMLCFYANSVTLTGAVDKRFAEISQQFYTDGASESVALSAKELLNEPKYSGVLETRAVKKAQMYAIIGEYEFGLDTNSGYINASNYYYSALCLLDESSEMKKTYAINYILSLALSGDTNKAQTAAYEYIDDTKSPEYTAVKAEIAYCEEKYDETLRYAQALKDSNASAEVKKSIYNLAALACEKKMDFENAVKWRELISNSSKTQQSIRHTAATLICAGNLLKKDEYYERAVNYYSKITLTAEDTINCAEALLALGRYQQCLSKLRNVITMDNVLICKENYIKAGAYLAVGRNSDAVSACENAVKSYNLLPEAKKSSVDVSNLEYLCGQLKIYEELR